MMRNLLAVTLCTSALALGACNENGMGPVAAAPPPPTARQATAMSVPGGTACATEINTYQSVVRSDLDTGNVEQKVYDQIQKELARAASACSAGKGGEAHALVAASKSRHGYRA